MRTPIPSCVGVIAWMHTFSPAKMWIARSRRIDQAAAAPAHAGPGWSCPGTTIDMDFMNLNQAAHGDREFGYIQTRARRPPSRRRRPRRRPPRSCAGSRAGAVPRSVPPTSHRLRLARFGDNMRDVAVTEGDKVAGAGPRSASRSTPTASTTSSRPSRTPTPRRSTTLVTEYARPLRRRRRAAARRGPPRLAACTAHASSWACATSLSAGGFGAFTSNFEDLGGLRQLPGLAVQRLMADGYGFGGEGDWKTSALVRT